MFFAVFAFLTPPVAVVALIASKLAGASYMKTSIEATKAAIGGFVIPFMFIYCPVLLLQPQEPFAAVQGVAACILCLFIMEVAFVGYFFTHCTSVERLLAAAGGLSMLLYFILQSQILFVVGFALSLFVVFVQRKKRFSRSSQALFQSEGT
jgi:TRAP-type uncharacterized transport system fused permease subunit